MDETPAAAEQHFLQGKRCLGRQEGPKGQNQRCDAEGWLLLSPNSCRMLGSAQGTATAPKANTAARDKVRHEATEPGTGKAAVCQGYRLGTTS